MVKGNLTCLIDRDLSLRMRMIYSRIIHKHFHSQKEAHLITSPKTHFYQKQCFFTKWQTKQAINYNTMADTARYLRILWYAAIVIVLNQRISFKLKRLFQNVE